MFCAKCGAEMAETARFCSNCAWTNSEFVNEKTQTVAEINYPSHPVNFQAAATVPAGDRRQESEKKQKKHKKGLVILIVLIFILGALGTGAYFFVTSDFHKTLVAEKCVLEGSFDKALRQLHDTDSDKAYILQKYIETEKAKADFLSSAESSGYKAAVRDMEEFRKQVKALKNSDYHLLSDELVANVNCYYEAIKYIDRSFETDYSLTDSDIMHNLNKVQYIMLNEVIRNNSEENVQTFTLAQLQLNINCAVGADDYLKKIDFKYVDISSRGVKENCFLVKDSDGKFRIKFR